jgi:streptomycin 6-kinase
MLPPEIPKDWSLTAPRLVARTPRATIWQVTQPTGQPAALKLLHPGQTEEAQGIAYLTALNGKGAVKVLAQDGNAILMEWCDGPSLGDLVRSGQDDEATELLCDVIQTLHAASQNPASLEPLTHRFAPLTDTRHNGDLATAAQIARQLLTTSPQQQPLHGDLHHDNILQSPRGWLAIDPKGVHGDPAYEPANAFRNPDGAGALIFSPARIAQLATRFAQRLGPPRDRLLGWAAAHCALSICWSREDGFEPTEDLRLLPFVLAAHAAV